MRRPIPIRHLSFFCITLVLAGCGVPATTSNDVLSAGIAEEAAGASVFSDDADPALAALPIVETELLVQAYPGADARALADLYAQVGTEVIAELEEIQVTVLDVPADRLTAIAGELAASALLEDIHKNYVYEANAVPDDPLFARQPHLERIDAPEAWDVTLGGEEMTIAIVDTGVQPDHPDLYDKIVEGWNVFDGNGEFEDVVGHGTQVAGVAAAVSDNNTGVAGVAWDSPILAVRATDEQGQATARDIAAGILWALGHGAKVINVSFAPLWSNSVVRTAAEVAFNRGALVVISAGNGGGYHSAAGYRQAMFVGATNDAGQIASFSDRGAFVDIVAPGTGIRATSLGSGYGLGNGTSFAAPIVAGVAALAWSVNPELRPVSIIKALTESATDLGTRGDDDTYGHGGVNAAGAVDKAAATTFVRDTVPPTLNITTPYSGITLRDRYVARLTATDVWGVADVVMLIDDIPLATDTHPPYRFIIDPAEFSLGVHEISFVATDLAGNASDAESVRVRFGGSSDGPGADDAPGVVFETPIAGSRISQDVTIRATVTASAGLATVEWLVDGVSAFVTSLGGRSAGISYRLRTSDLSLGTHTIAIIVTDQRGQQQTGTLDLVKR